MGCGKRYGQPVACGVCGDGRALMHGILVKLFWLVGGSMLDWRVGAANYTNLIEAKKTPTATQRQ